jgi:hypothetical protein
MTLFPPAREEGRALRWGGLDDGLRAPKSRRRLPFSTAGEGVIFVHIGMGVALRWDAGELPSTTPQAERSQIGQRTKRRRSLAAKGRYRSSHAHRRGPWERPLSAQPRHRQAPQLPFSTAGVFSLAPNHIGGLMPSFST